MHVVFKERCFCIQSQRHILSTTISGLNKQYQKWWCSVCDVGFEYKSKLERHDEESAKHRALVTLQQSNSVPAEDDGGVCPALEDVFTDTTDARKVSIIWPKFLYTG